MAMPEWVKKGVSANFARASRAGRRAAKTEPRAARAAYDARNDELWIELTNGAAITIPVKLIPGLKGVAPSEVRSVEVLGRGAKERAQGRSPPCTSKDKRVTSPSGTNLIA